MRLVVTLLVRDEADIVADTMNYHLDAGADLILVTDNGSADSTRDIVRAFVDEGTARLFVEPAPIHSQWRWVTRMARTAYWDHSADWVINTDADEFWWPESGDLKDVLGAVDPMYGAVRVPRFDFRPLTAAGGGPRETPYRETSSLRFIGGPLEPKTCHRADPRVIVGQGNHEVSGVSGAELEGSGLLSVFHFPTRSREQFRRGVGNAGAAYAQSSEFVATTGEVKRALYESLERGDLDEVFGSRELTAAEAQAAVQSGAIVEDHRLMQVLAGSTGRREPTHDLVLVSLDGTGTEPIVSRLGGAWRTVRKVNSIDIATDPGIAEAIALVPTPSQWVNRAIDDDIDVEEAAYEWIREVSSIASAASRVLWVSSSRSGDSGTFKAVEEWLDGGESGALLDDASDDGALLSATCGPAFALAASVHSSLQNEPERFQPLARLIHAVTTDDQLAFRLGWYLGAPDIGTDTVTELEERLAGADASYAALRSRKSVQTALKIAKMSGRLRRVFGRDQQR